MPSNVLEQFLKISGIFKTEKCKLSQFFLYFGHLCVQRAMNSVFCTWPTTRLPCAKNAEIFSSSCRPAIPTESRLKSLFTRQEAARKNAIFPQFRPKDPYFCGCLARNNYEQVSPFAANKMQRFSLLPSGRQDLLKSFSTYC